MTETKTGNEAVREALGLFRSMVMSGEKLTPEAQEIWDRAYAVADPNPRTVEEEAAHTVVLAEALEPVVREWLEDNTSPGAGYGTIDFNEIPDLVAHVSGKLVVQGFGKR